MDLHQRRQQHVTHPDVALQCAYSRSQRRAVSRAVAQRGPGAASQAWLRQRECRELCTTWSNKLRPAASEASQPPSAVRTARQGTQTRPAASPRRRTALSHARNVPTEASVARAAGHIFADAAAGVGSAQPGFYGDCCAPAYRATMAAAFYRVLSP